MDVSTEVTDGVTIYRIAGRIDSASGPALDTAVKAGLTGATPRVMIDMSGVSYVSSAGLRAVLLAAKHVKNANGNLAVFGLQPAVGVVFSVSGISNLVTIGTDEADARSRL